MKRILILTVIALCLFSFVDSALGWFSGPWQSDRIYYHTYFEADVTIRDTLFTDFIQPDASGTVTFSHITTTTIVSVTDSSESSYTDTIGTYGDAQVTFIDDVVMDSTLTISMPAGLITFSGATSATILSDSDKLTIGGVNGATNNENATFDFETTANTITVGTGTGVTSWQFGTIDLKTDYVWAQTFDTDVALAAVTLSDTTLAADGTQTNIDINITPKGTGVVNLGGGLSITGDLVPSSGDTYDLGSASAYWDSLFVGDITMSGNAYVAEYIYHTGDTDTYLRFEDDKLTLAAGAATLITLVEDTADTVTIAADQTTITGDMTMPAIEYMEADTLIVKESGEFRCDIEIREDNAATNAAVLVELLSVTSTGTPAAGLGVAQQFKVETAAGSPGNQEVIAILEAITTDVTGASEDGDFVFKLMAGGAAAAEKFRIASTGAVTMTGALSGVTTLSMNNQLTNTLAIGTAPLVITSTTVVPNLNVDQVDGLNASSTATASTILALDADKDLELGTGDVNAAAGSFSAEVHFTNNSAAATFGAVATDADVVLAFDAVTAQGSITYMEDEDRFDFDNKISTLGDASFGTITQDARLHAEEDNAATAAAVPIGRISVTSTGTPAAGLGPSWEFEVETAAGAPGNQEIVAAIDGIATDVTGAAEIGAVVIKTMKAGAAATEDVRFGGGQAMRVVGDGGSNIWENQAIIRDSKAQAVGTGGGITFDGKYTDAGAYATHVGFVKAMKEDAVTGQYAFGLAFGTRVHGNNTTEKVRITSAGNFGVGTDEAYANLEVAAAAPEFAIYDSDIEHPTSFATIDSSAITMDCSSAPVLDFYGTDGDNWNLGINTSDQALFQNAGGGYVFDAEGHFQNNAAAATFGAVATDADVVLAFDAVTNQGSITYMEDEDRFDFDNDVDVIGDITGATIASDGNVKGTTYGSDSSISDAELLTIDDGAVTEIAVGGGAGSAMVWTTATGSGAPVRATSPTIATPTFTGFVTRSVAAGLTAVNPGVQGDGPLTADVNQISTCGAANDARTLPAAPATGSYEIFIINDGAETLEIWPASGDDLGAGANNATTLAAGANVTFCSYDATTWKTK